MFPIKKYERMVKLSLKGDEEEAIEHLANRLLKSFEDIRSVDTSKTEALVRVLDVENHLREDEAHKTVDRENLLSMAPMDQDGYFQVPKTVD